ncbi:MAG: hypothetical protein ACYDD1_12445 [Caulobacteraceae bacterium]
MRSVQALTITAKPGAAATEPPIFMDVNPTELLIDGSYQRDLADRGVRLITRIIEAWDWRRFKPPVCAWTDAGLVVIDGQHTAIAAATHGGFPTIPVMVVEAKGAEAQASAFVGHNRDRLSLHPTQIHAAAVKAGEPDAVRIEAICARAGVSVVRNPYGSRRYAVGETISVGTIGNLIREHGDARAVAMLQTLVAGGLAPITKDHIRAVDELLSNAEFADEIEASDLAVSIMKTAGGAEKDAKLFAADHCAPFWRGLVNAWFRACKKRRRT